jgi:hypothetical protein
MTSRVIAVRDEKPAPASTGYRILKSGINNDCKDKSIILYKGFRFSVACTGRRLGGAITAVSPPARRRRLPASWIDPLPRPRRRGRRQRNVGYYGPCLLPGRGRRWCEGCKTCTRAAASSPGASWGVAGVHGRAGTHAAQPCACARALDAHSPVWRPLSSPSLSSVSLPAAPLSVSCVTGGMSKIFVADQTSGLGSRISQNCPFRG